MATVTGHPLLLTRADRPVNNARDAKISIHHSVAVAFLFGARRGMIVMMSRAARVEVISRSGPSWRCCSVSSPQRSPAWSAGNCVTRKAASPSDNREFIMLNLAVTLLIIALIAAVLGFGEDTPLFFRIGSAFVIAATLPLALGIAGDLYVATAKAAESTALGAGLGIGALVVLVTLWYALPLMLRGNSLSAKQLMVQARS